MINNGKRKIDKRAIKYIKMRTEYKIDYKSNLLFVLFSNILQLIKVLEELEFVYIKLTICIIVFIDICTHTRVHIYELTYSH